MNTVEEFCAISHDVPRPLVLVQPVTPVQCVDAVTAAGAVLGRFAALEAARRNPAVAAAIRTLDAGHGFLPSGGTVPSGGSLALSEATVKELIALNVELA